MGLSEEDIQLLKEAFKKQYGFELDELGDEIVEVGFHDKDGNEVPFWKKDEEVVDN